MRKNLFILAAALAVCYSCSNDETVEVNQGNEISFRPMVERTTRAADVTENKLQSFNVTAYLEGDTPSEYFSDVTFTASGTVSAQNPSTGETYTSATKYYWPSSGYLSFYAYSPTDGASNQVTMNDYKTFVVIPSTTISSQVDFVYAGTTGKNKANNSAGVALNFRHTGAKIVCQVKNSSTALKFAVDGWKVGYLSSSGKFTYAAASTDTKNSATLAYGQWSDWDTPSVETKYESALSQVVTIDAKTVENNTDNEHITLLAGEMILVPQRVTAATKYANNGTSAANDPLNGSFIAVKLKIMNNDASSTVIAAGASDATIWAIWPIGGYNWEPGKKYTYTIDLAGGGYFETNQNETTVDEDLDPILEGAEIKFVNVTVDDWTDVAKTVPES